MLSSSRTIVRIVSRPQTGARLLTAAHQHRARLPDSGLHTQHHVMTNPKVREVQENYSSC